MTSTVAGPPTTDSDAVLSANLEFYRAFGTANFQAMDALWARRAQVLCLHPGWQALIGRAAVMESWRALLAQGRSAFRILCHDERAFLYEGFAVVLCEEEVPGGTLAATNVFTREDGAWRMIHHQASAIIPQYRASSGTDLLH